MFVNHRLLNDPPKYETGDNANMVRKMIVLIAGLAMFATAASAQTTTTYTTTADACWGKANQYCTLPVAETPDNGTTQVIIDSRNNYGYLYIGAFIVADQVQGAYSGFVANPDGTHSPFNGVASFESFDGTVSGSFTFYAYYASTCSGRGCGGTLGWHYHILSGSTVTVTQ